MSTGVCWPIDATTGKASTVVTGREMIASSLDGVNASLAARTRAEKDWRGGYADRIVELVKGCASSPQAALQNAQAGMDFCYEHFHFERNGVRVSLKNVLDTPLEELCSTSSTFFETATVEGPPSSELKAAKIPVHGVERSANELVDIANAWSSSGVIEPSAAEAWKWVVVNGGPGSAVEKGLSDTIFVVFGAGAAIGPFVPLMKTGATVAAVDLPRSAVWDRLCALAEQSPRAKLLAPRNTLTGQLGADLIEQAPEVARWVCSLDQSKRLVLGSFGYADGANFVRLALAMDLIKMLVLKHRENDKVALSYLCSPTDAFLVDEATRLNSRKRYEALSLSAAVRPLVSAASGGKSLQPNYPATPDPALANSERVVDCFVVQQGPNYAIAKRIQSWRAILARCSGIPVSSNVAPASATQSVTKNALLAAGYGGAQFFPPIEIFQPETANHVMLISLYHDIFNEKSCAYPSFEMENPLDLFAIGAVHGGMQRTLYKVRSVLEIAVLLHYLDKFKVPITIGSASLYALRRTFHSKL